MDVFNINPDKWIENEKEYLDCVKHNEDIRNKIPLLNVNNIHTIKNHSLVRFKAMIQDDVGPQMYFDKIEVVNVVTGEVRLLNGKYFNNINENKTELICFNTSTAIKERYTYVAISIPGENEWVSNIEKFTQPNKLDSDGDSDVMDVNEDFLKSISKLQQKRFPLVDRKGQIYFIKIYENISYRMEINSCWEFIGFLSHMYIEPDTSIDDEINNRNLPTIHCVYFHQLKHNNPLLINELALLTHSKEWMQRIREELIFFLTQLMCGDELTAEYLLCHLISSVYVRTDSEVLGKFSLNITKIPKLHKMEYVPEVYKFIEMIVTKSIFLPLTLTNLNKFCFNVSKDFDNGCLLSSMSQLSNNTHIIFDESKLKDGTLNEKGVASVRALKKTIKTQTILYDYTYYSMKIKCDIPILIFSCEKSILPSDYRLILQPAEHFLDDFFNVINTTKNLIFPHLINDFRKYLTLCRLIQYNINDEIQEVINKDFVDMRKKNNVTADDLHSILVVARLISISEGETTLYEYNWKKACTLEQSRKLRLK